MVLTDKEIREYIAEYKEKGLEKPLLEGFNENNLQSESYDVTISNTIMKFKKEVRCIQLDDQIALDNMYEKEEIKKEGYILSPKEYILIALNEKINLPDFLTAHIRPRTKFTRLGLIVSDQHCNSTYSGVLNIGLYNATDNAIKIMPGIGIAQIVFEELKNVPSEEKLYKNRKNASYQNETGDRGAKFDPEFQKRVDELTERLFDKE